MNPVYQAIFPIRVLDTDMFGLCRPSSIMNFLQEAATEHAGQMQLDRLGVGTEHQMIWMLVRLRYTLLRPLRGNEVLTVRTAYHKPDGPFAMRDFKLLAGNETVGHALSTWAIADAENRSLLNARDILGSYPVEEAYPCIEKLGKIRMPKEMEDAGERRIGYSETDINGHANNTRYADYACDAIHFETLRGMYVRELQITYSAECLAGQMVHLLQKKAENTVYVRGVDKEGKGHFDIRMELAEI